MRKGYFTPVLAALSLASTLAATTATAGHQHAAQLSEVEFNVVTEKWVKTKTAKVTANVHSTVKQAELANIHNQILSILKQLADRGDWHITTFNRSQDRSGLERIYVVAEARLTKAYLPISTDAPSV